MRGDRYLTAADDTRSIHSTCSRQNLLTTSMPNLGVKVVEAKANMRASEKAAKAGDVHLLNYIKLRVFKDGSESLCCSTICNIVKTICS